MAAREQKTQAQPTHAEAPALDMDAMLEEAGRALLAVQAAGRDTSFLSVEKKAAVLEGLARALGLNPLSQPVIFLKTQGREVVYVTKVGTDQIASRLRLQRRTIHGPDVRKVHGKDLAFCQVEVTAPDGRSEMSTATLPITDPVNDLMKVESKAKRRATLSIAGLGLLTEEEIETIPGAHHALRGASQPASHNEEHQSDRGRAEAARHEAFAEEQAEAFAPLTDLVESIRQCVLPGDVVDRWFASTEDRRGWTVDDNETVRVEATARVAKLQKSNEKAARAWLAKAIKERGAKAAGNASSSKTGHEGMLDSLTDAGDLTELRRLTVESLRTYPAMAEAIWTAAIDAALRHGPDEETFRRMVDDVMNPSDDPQPPAGGGGGNATGGNTSATGKGRNGAQGAATTQRAANDVTELAVVSDAAQAIIDAHGTNPWALKNSLRKHREELRATDVEELARVLARITPPDPQTKALLNQVGAEKIVRGLTGLRSAA